MKKLKGQSLIEVTTVGLVIFTVTLAGVFFFSDSLKSFFSENNIVKTFTSERFNKNESVKNYISGVSAIVTMGGNSINMTAPVESILSQKMQDGSYVQTSGSSGKLNETVAVLESYLKQLTDLINSAPEGSNTSEIKNAIVQYQKAMQDYKSKDNTQVAGASDPLAEVVKQLDIAVDLNKDGNLAKNLNTVLNDTLSSLPDGNYKNMLNVYAKGALSLGQSIDYSIDSRADTSIEMLLGSMNSANVVLQDMQKEIDINNNSLTENESSIVSLNNLIASQNQSIVSANADLATKNEELKNLNNILYSQTQPLAQANQTLATQQSSLNSISNTLNSQTLSLAQANQTLTSQQSNLASINNTLNSQTQSLAQANQTLTSQQNALASLDQTFNIQSQSLASKTNSFAFMVNQLNDIQNQIDGSTMQRASTPSVITTTTTERSCGFWLIVCLSWNTRQVNSTVANPAYIQLDINLANLYAAKADANSLKNGFKTDIDTLNSNISAINLQRYFANASINTTQSNVNNLNQNIANTNNQKSVINNQINATQSTIGSINLNIANANNQKSVINNQISATQSNIDSINLNIANTNNQKSAINGQISATQINLATLSTNSITNQKSAINGQISATQINLATLSTNSITNQNQVRATKTQIDELKANLATLKINLTKQKMNDLNTLITDKQQRDQLAKYISVYRNGSYSDILPDSYNGQKLCDTLGLQVINGKCNMSL